MLQFMHSFRGKTAPPGILNGLRDGRISSFCLFAYNVDAPAQLRQLNERLYAAATEGGHPPPIIGIDQEGGQLMAITAGATELPGNMALGATRSPELAYAAGRVLARELLAMGVNMNFAPSVDVNNNPANPVIGTRSFGESPALVGSLAVAMIHGMQDMGVIATAKHFPGHGDVAGDTHYGGVYVDHPLLRLTEVELPPFKAAIDGGVGAVMTAHINATALDPNHPATLSPIILRQLLRSRMDFEGLIITDAMDMHAVARLGRTKAVCAALEAGVDLALLGHIPAQLFFAKMIPYTPNPDSVRRIQDARSRLPAWDILPSLDVVGCAEHQQVAREIAEKSITLVRDAGRLPLKLSPDAQVAVVTIQPENLTPADTSADVTIGLEAAIRRYHPRTSGIQLARGADPVEVRAVANAVSDADVIIIGTINAGEDPAQVQLVNVLLDRGKQPIVAALRVPYDLTHFLRVETYLCTYSIRQPSIDALARTLFGELVPSGTLPCAIPGV